MVELGVNIDHVATLRQARRTYEPDPVWAAAEAELAGADGITVHLREDRRHISDRDVEVLRKTVQCKLNLEMSLVPEIVDIAIRTMPDQATLVPERRQEVTTEGGLDAAATTNLSAWTFPNGCHIAEVEVDPDTGTIDIVAYSIVDDFGVVLNPMLVEGQVHGGIAQGIGQALLEHGAYDPESGQLVTGSYMDYCMPRALNLPPLTLGFTETLCPSNPLGIKGCGEAGAIAAPPAVINAITDAIGVRDLPMPATSQTVWLALQAARPRAAAE